MKRTILSTISAAALLALLAMPAAAGHGGEPTVIVMQHLCNADIQSEADFQAVEDAGAGGQEGGEGTLPGLVATVLACPTVFLPSDTGTGGIAADPTEFNYTVVDSAGASYGLQADGQFMAAELCESDINLDANGNGEIESDVCLDVSMYGFAPTAEGAVTVTQTAAPGNSRFGTLRLTPASTDEMAVVSATQGVIELDTTQDTQVEDPPLPLAEYNDDVIVLHVYNFQNAETMPDAAMEAPQTASLPLVVFGFGSLLAAAGVSVLARRRA